MSAPQASETLVVDVRMAADQLVSFVVLNYNGGEEVLACIDSVLEQEGIRVECIVVDNASADDSLSQIRSRYGERVAILEQDRNLGFAGGMNAGTAAATGQFIAYINQDLILDPNYGSLAAELFHRDDKIGAVGGMVRRLGPEGPTDELDAAGWFLRGRLAVQPIRETSGGTIRVFGVSGACPVFRRATLEDIRLPDGGYFDEYYFLYFEDIDLFFRAQLRSWHVLYEPRMHAWHYRSLSSGGGKRFYEKPFAIQWLHFRNRYLTAIKDIPAGLVPTLAPRMVAAEIALIPYLLLRAPLALAALVYSWIRVAVALPRVLSQRRVLQSRRTARAHEIRRFVRGI